MQGQRFDTDEECIERCDELGTACGGFALEDLSVGGVNAKFCTVAGPGAGLAPAAGVSFYRKKTPINSVSFTSYSNLAVPSDAYDWYSTNMTVNATHDLCASDTRCAGKPRQAAPSRAHPSARARSSAN